jgi:hypothetical protein
MLWILLKAVAIQRPMNMTPQQCRAARTLLEWTRDDLADNADLGVGVVEDFELGHNEINNSVIDAMQVAFEYAGVEFLPSDDADGALVRFRGESGF